MTKKPIVWTIAGSDSGGGAGIQADLLTFNSLGVHGCSVITALTAQNSVSVKHVFYASSKSIAAQLSVLQQDLPAKVIKIGMLGSTKVIHTIANFLKTYQGIVVCDPVMVATSGAALLDQKALDAFINTILPHVDILTPNLAEAEKLTQCKIVTSDETEQAAKSILKLGPKSVLIKGGHSNNQLAQDYWTDGCQHIWLSSPRQPHQHNHGSGCTLSAAIASVMALGYTLKDALVIAKMTVNQGLRHAQQLGAGPGPVAHLGWPNMPQDLPHLTFKPQYLRLSFPNCGQSPLGLYPIVDRAQWLQRLLPLGVTTIQLRVKDLHGEALENEIKTAIAIANAYQARLFVNDHWALAIQYGAYGVHLGQDDLRTADLIALANAGLRLGVSTHCYYEVAYAHAVSPSYIAIGPIFPTTSKKMDFAPQGVKKLTYWRELLNYPLVAIGGIDLENIDQVKQTGVDGIAMISAITQAQDPANATRMLLNACHRERWKRSPTIKAISLP